MTAQTPRLSRSQQDNLAAVCKIGSVALQAVADELESAGFVISKDKITDLMDKTVGPDRGAELAGFVFGVVAGYRRNKDAAKAALRTIDQFVASGGEPDGPLSTWAACRPALERLLSSESVRLAAKALDVSYDFERVYMDGRFLTSLRPVFDEGREVIKGATVVQTLRLDYLASDGLQATLSLALDSTDIENLKQSCDDALKKAEAILNKATEEWKLPTIMPRGGSAA